MNPKPNYRELELRRFLKRITNNDFENVEKKIICGEILRLIFAYQRKINGLDLRYNWRESRELAFFTLEELKAKKNKDPLLNEAYDCLIKISDQNGEKNKVDLILGLAERIIHGTQSKNKAIQKKERNRIDHPLKTLLKDIFDDYKNHNFEKITSELIKRGKEERIIIEVESNGRIICNENMKCKPTLSKKTIGTWITEISN